MLSNNGVELAAVEPSGTFGGLAGAAAHAGRWASAEYDIANA